MDEASLREVLSGLPLGPLRYFDSLSSTNDVAAGWIEAGAPDLALVVADEQTSGRGRLRRRWFTPAGSALAFSLVLRSLTGKGPAWGSTSALPYRWITRLTSLGSLAVCQSLQNEYSLTAQIKWPNDVLAGGRKLAGVLAEAIWQGEQPAAVILGIGVNITPASLAKESEWLYPATCVETAIGKPVDRGILLRGILGALLDWRARLASADFMQAWEDLLAFRGETVQIIAEGKEPVEGEVAGLDEEGALRLRLPGGQMATIQIGEVRLRPVDSP